jgi:hypothetical protein
VTIHIRPVTALTGAEISGVDLRRVTIAGPPAR